MTNILYKYSLFTTVILEDEVYINNKFEMCLFLDMKKSVNAARSRLISRY